MKSCQKSNKLPNLVTLLVLESKKVLFETSVTHFEFTTIDPVAVDQCDQMVRLFLYLAICDNKN